MAPGIGGFNIDPPPSRASPFERDLAIDIRRVGAELFASRRPVEPIQLGFAPFIAEAGLSQKKHLHSKL
jgi:hypothetical protein